MSLKNFLNEKRLKVHKASDDELNNLFRIVNRDINDAKISQLSADRRFITSYNAALQLATILLRAFGYRTNTNKGGHHWVTFGMLPDILGASGEDYGNYFEASRIKRNMSDYNTSGEISDSEANELLSEVIRFREIVLNWLGKNYEAYENLSIID